MSDKILIIDDDLDTLKLVGLMLRKQGFQIMAASSGAQGLELVATSQPDLVLLDVMMPGMDGFEVARRLRADEKTQNLPIIMFTAKSQLDDKVAGFEAGADDYLTKPTHPAEMVNHIRTLLSRTSKGVKGGKTDTLSRPPEEPAYFIGVIAARGGLGVSTVAVNLAAVLGKKSAAKVILAEFRPGQGTLHYDLGVEKAVGLNELLGKAWPDISKELVAEKLVKHQDGFKFLPASSRPIDALLLQNHQQFEAILHNMEFLGRFVVVDLGCGLTALNQKLALAFDELIVVVEPYEHSLQHSQALVEDLMSLGVEKDKLFVAVNYRLRSDTPLLSVVQIQSYFKAPIDVSFTPAPELYLQANRKYQVASLMQEESVTALQFNTLATKIESRARKKSKI
ncbi:MAG TPA: response regulator [Anaerolineales bacterium]